MCVVLFREFVSFFLLFSLPQTSEIQLISLFSFFSPSLHLPFLLLQIKFNELFSWFFMAVIVYDAMRSAPFSARLSILFATLCLCSFADDCCVRCIAWRVWWPMRYNGRYMLSFNVMTENSSSVGALWKLIFHCRRRRCLSLNLDSPRGSTFSGARNRLITRGVCVNVNICVCMRGESDNIAVKIHYNPPHASPIHSSSFTKTGSNNGVCFDSHNGNPSCW